MLEAFLTFMVVKTVVNGFFKAMYFNADVVELLLTGAVIFGILWMIVIPHKKWGWIILVAAVAAFVLLTTMVPYGSTIATWAGVVIAIVAVVFAKRYTYKVLRARKRVLPTWQMALIYLL